MTHIDVWSYHESTYILIDDNVKTNKEGLPADFNQYLLIFGNSDFIPTSFEEQNTVN